MSIFTNYFVPSSKWMACKVACFLVFFFSVALLPFEIKGQQCSFVLNGSVKDLTTEESLPFASLYVEETKAGVLADDAGFFQFEEVFCAGSYHIVVRHIGCEPQRIYLHLTGDTVLSIRLAHHTELMEAVLVSGSLTDNSTQNATSVGGEEIEKRGDGTLGSLLERLTGVSSLRNGSGIRKPIIHGLFGNRITVLNNGVPQSGQQWGNDHAPEIDPFVASQLSVIKGVAGLAYGGGTLGGLVVVEPGKIDDEPHLHGKFNYLYATNGRGHTLNAQLSKAAQWAKWRLITTLRHQGDGRSPDYFLRNTGRREANLALTLEKQLGEWQNQLYYSYFSTTLGILRGSQIGNLTDLSLAIGREEPFFTEPDFSNRLSAPKQQVAHHLLKWQSSRMYNEQQSLRLTYALQLNNRQEFDIRRGGRTERPALGLLQWSHRLAANYHRNMGDFYLLKTGIQLDIADNNNDSDTGILPLIPNYQSFTPAAFGILQRERDRWLAEAGLRYEFIQLNANTISRELPRRFVDEQRSFQNMSAGLGLKYRWKARQQLSANLGLARRAPAVNELYSIGLHQGVSGIEEGDASLTPETAIKASLGLDWASEQGHFFLQALAYYQNIQDYIYLQALPDFRLTIRGAFPVFQYRQTQASIAGLDLLFSIEPNEAFKIVTKYSYLRGQDESRQQPLVFMPPNRLSSSWELALPEGRTFFSNQLALEGIFVARQKRWEAEQDLLAPPSAYFLLDANASTHLKVGKSFLHLSLRVDNLLNIRYRDYLNRLRYYADELGRNVVTGLSWDF